MNTKIISAFPACGKTHLHMDANKDYTTLDSDSSKFSWLLDNKGDTTGVRNPNFPDNYINYIKANIGMVDYIFVSSHQEVREALEANDLSYAIVQPSAKLRSEWIGRCWLRGSPQGFLETLDKFWDEWTNEVDTTQRWDAVGVTYLQSNEYLKDKMWFLSTLTGNTKE